MSKQSNNSRRDFLKKGTLTIAGGALFEGIPFNLNASGHETQQIRLGLIGCGRRGTGAAFQAIKASKAVRLVAMGDTFEDMLNKSHSQISTEFKNQVDVPQDRRYIGFEAYKKVIEASDAILLATPPPFRPLHFEAAIKSNRHVFMEKPLAVDVPGFHKIIEVGKLAEQKQLNVVVGLQSRYDTGNQQLVKRVQDGMIGDINSFNVYYNVGAPKIHPRVPGATEMEYQLRNWRYFSWLWGGQIAGQTIHQIDVINWIMQDYPVVAKGMGGRIGFDGPNQGNTYDHFYVEYQYPNGVKMHMQCRNIDNCWDRMGYEVQGTTGRADERKRIYDMKGNMLWRFRERDQTVGSSQMEQNAFINSILNGEYINNTEYGAKSTLTTIIGRMAAHSGQEIKLEDALASKLILGPKEFSWDAQMPDLPDENDNYPIPIPGKTNVL